MKINRKDEEVSVTFTKQELSSLYGKCKIDEKYHEDDDISKFIKLIEGELDGKEIN